MTVAAQATAHGVSIAVAAKRGRIACLTACLDADGAVQLSSPIVYAAEAPRVLGASYQLLKQREMELGTIVDMVLLPWGPTGPLRESLAVLSERCVCQSG